MTKRKSRIKRVREGIGKFFLNTLITLVCLIPGSYGMTYMKMSLSNVLFRDSSFEVDPKKFASLVSNGEYKEISYAFPNLTFNYIWGKAFLERQFEVDGKLIHIHQIAQDKVLLSKYSGYLVDEYLKEISFLAKVKLWVLNLFRWNKLRNDLSEFILRKSASVL